MFEGAQKIWAQVKTVPVSTDAPYFNPTISTGDVLVVISMVGSFLFFGIRILYKMGRMEERHEIMWKWWLRKHEVTDDSK